MAALIITVYFGLFYQASKDSKRFIESDVVKWFVFIMVFVSTFAFLAHFIFKMHSEVVRISAKKKFKKVFNLVTCWRKDYDEYIADKDLNPHQEENNYPTIYSRKGTLKRISLKRALTNRFRRFSLLTKS